MARMIDVLDKPLLEQSRFLVCLLEVQFGPDPLPDLHSGSVVAHEL
jgi:hypothetical protein